MKIKSNLGLILIFSCFCSVENNEKVISLTLYNKIFENENITNHSLAKREVNKYY